MEGERKSDKGPWEIQYPIFPTRTVFRRAAAAGTLNAILIRARRLQQGCSSSMPRRADQNAVHNFITTE